MRHRCRQISQKTKNELALTASRRHKLPASVGRIQPPVVSWKRWWGTADKQLVHNCLYRWMAVCLNISVPASCLASPLHLSILTAHLLASQSLFTLLFLTFFALCTLWTHKLCFTQNNVSSKTQSADRMTYCFCPECSPRAAVHSLWNGV